MQNNNFTFIDLFAGIGGFHLALSSIGGKCVFISEIDKYARITYQNNYNINNINFNYDIRNINIDDIPEYDILCAGFPCQPFSQAGKKQGFTDNLQSERGNLFFCIIDILEQTKPKAFILENVKHLVNHDNGNTLKIILKTLNDLNYYVEYKVLKASDYNIPQHRPRVYFVGFNKDLVNTTNKFIFPFPQKLKTTMSDIFHGKCNKNIGFTLRVGGRGSKITDRRNWEFYYVDGIIKRIGIKEAKLMMGFPESFKFPVSQTQAMKQLGNSVCVNVLKKIATNVIKYLEINNNMTHNKRLFL